MPDLGVSRIVKLKYEVKVESDEWSNKIIFFTLSWHARLADINCGPWLTGIYLSQRSWNASEIGGCARLQRVNGMCNAISDVLQGRSQWDLHCCELVIYRRQLTAGSSHALARYVGQEISAVMCYSWLRDKADGHQWMKWLLVISDLARLSASWRLESHLHVFCC